MASTPRAFLLNCGWANGEGTRLALYSMYLLDRFFKALLDFYLKVDDDSTSTYKAEHHHRYAQISKRAICDRYVSSGMAKGGHLEY